MTEEISIFWFRRDLRLADNTALFHAIREGKPILPIFIFDSNILDKLEDKSDARLQFILQTLQEMNKYLVQFNSKIHLLHGDPVQVINSILQEKENVRYIFCNRDYETYAKSRDSAVESICNEKNVQFLSFKDHVFFESQEIKSGKGEPYKVFTPYKNNWLQKLEDQSLHNYEVDLKEALWTTGDFPVISSLEELGFQPSNIVIPALTINDKKLVEYGDKRNFPSIDGTTRLGIHLRHGTLSIREAVRKAVNNSADTWLNELIWRDFYSMILNSFPHVEKKAFKPKYDGIPWRTDEEDFSKWCEGKTGYPIVDAGMRELNATGYMHNRVRMITASFLTKHLLLPWQWGEHYFAQKLLDFELASNNGGWQWAAGTGTDAQPYFRVFNPTSQTEKFDKNLEYIRQWIPELSTFEYPKPIVDHKQARVRAIETYKKALQD